MTAFYLAKATTSRSDTTNTPAPYSTQGRAIISASLGKGIDVRKLDNLIAHMVLHAR
jgi:hypothetical protein